MSTKSIKSLSLAAFLGLFGVYNLTAYNFRIGSLNSDGLVIKYSKRGLASTSVTCRFTSSKIDKVTADNMATDACRYHKTSKKIDNGDIEYTVTTYYKGHISEKTKVFSQEEAEANSDHSIEFIKSVVTTSKDKFDQASEATNTVKITQSTTQTEAPSTKPKKPRNQEKPGDEGQAPEKSKKENPLPNNNESTDESGFAIDDSLDTDTDELTSKRIKKALENYRELKEHYNQCTLNGSADKDFKRVFKHDKYLETYAKQADELEEFEGQNVDGQDIPSSLLPDFRKNRLLKFISTVNALNELVEARIDEDLNSDNSTMTDPTCILNRAKTLSGKEQYELYKKYFQPELRSSLLLATPENIDQATAAIDSNDSPIKELAKTNRDIHSSVLADLHGAQTRVDLEKNRRSTVEAQKLPEIQKVQKLQQLTNERSQIIKKYEDSLSSLSSNNTEIASDLSQTGKYWAEQMLPLEQAFAELDQKKQPTDDPLADTTGQAGLQTENPHGTSADVDANQLAKQELEELYKRIRDIRLQASKNGSGNSRSQPRIQSGTFNKRNKSLRGRSVPQVGEPVSTNESGSLQ